MKIGIISDTHGDCASIKRAAAQVKNANFWLHAGDYDRDAEYLSKLTDKKVIAVRGNCDTSSVSKFDEFVVLGGNRIWLTHGHRYNVRDGQSELAWWGKQFGADIIIYGHTHVPYLGQQGRMLIINPGSTASSRQGSFPSCALLTIFASKVMVSIVPV